MGARNSTNQHAALAQSTKRPTLLGHTGSSAAFSKDKQLLSGKKAVVESLPAMTAKGFLSCPPPQYEAGPHFSDGASPDLRSRSCVLQDLFRSLGDSKQALREQEVRIYADLCGYEGSAEDWNKEYLALCTEYGWDASAGADIVRFAAFVGDEQSSGYCTDEELLSLTNELDRIRSWCLAEKCGTNGVVGDVLTSTQPNFENSVTSWISV